MLSFFHNLTLLIKEDTVFELGSNDKLESGVYVFYKIYDNDFNGHTGFLYVDGTDLKLEETNLVPEMIENTLYMAYSNDVAMQVNGRIVVLIEHQSTINNNMPLRLLDYVARIYEHIVPAKMKFYRRLEP